MDEFEQYRPLLFSIAYQMLGSAMEAEDIVQEAYLRSRTVASVESPKAFLTTIVTRLCLNQLKSARVQREQYLGTWLPEPLVTGDESPLLPSVWQERQESISIAFLVLLESLTPPERAVLLLRDVFDYGYAEIAAMLGQEEANCRQLYSRAKKHLAEHRPRFHSTPEQHRQMLDHFIQVVEGGQVESLTTLLAHDAVLWADGSGRPGAATHPIHGNEAVARFVLGTVRFLPAGASIAVEQVNHEAALVIRAEGKVFLVVFVEAAEGKIQTIRAIGSPAKLRHLA